VDHKHLTKIKLTFIQKILIQFKQEPYRVRTLISTHGFKLRQGKFRLDIRREFFHAEGGDAMEQVAQGGCRCPIPGGVQSQAERGSEQPGLVVGDPAHRRGG